MMTSYNLSAILVELACGDLSRLVTLLKAEHEQVRCAREQLSEYRLTRAAVLKVLLGLKDGAFSLSAVQEWASFMRCGFVGAPGGAPVQPIEIDWDPDAQDIIADVLSRLDELGDTIDGTVDEHEVNEMIARLTN